jgi:hypothetical protein
MTSAPSIIIDQTHRRADVLVDPNWLEEHLDDLRCASSRLT